MKTKIHLSENSHRSAEIWLDHTEKRIVFKSTNVRFGNTQKTFNVYDTFVGEICYITALSTPSDRQDHQIVYMDENENVRLFRYGKLKEIGLKFDKSWTPILKEYRGDFSSFLALMAL